MSEDLPNVVEAFAGQYPQLWEAYNNLGKASAGYNHLRHTKVIT